MKKSKLMIISSFALAMVASLVMAFAMMNVTQAEPASVEATIAKEGKFYIINYANYTNIYMWKSSNVDDKNASWPGVALSDEDIVGTCYGSNVYELDPSEYDRVIFNNGSEQTDDISILESHIYSIWTGDSPRFTDLGNLDDYCKIQYANFSNDFITSYIVPNVEKTVHYYNEDSWSDVYGYSWYTIEETNYYNTDWHGTKMISEGEGWFKLFLFDTRFEKVIFNDNGSNQTSDILISSTNHFYRQGFWFPTVEAAEYMASGYSSSIYYLVGSIGGTDKWYPSADRAMTDRVYGDNKAQKVMTLAAWDTLKVYHDGKWLGGQYENGHDDVNDEYDRNIGVAVNTDYYADIVITAAGIYVINVDSHGEDETVYDGHKLYEKSVWVSNYLGNEITYHKVATTKKHLLLATGFVLANHPDATLIGYVWSDGTTSDSAFDNKYYTGVSYTDSTSQTISDIFKSNPKGFDALIVHELAVTTGKTYTIQAQIKNGEYVIASSDVYSKPIS